MQIVLRRMVFASSAIAQAAALGVALSFWVPAIVDPAGHAARHASDPAAHIVPLYYEPVLWALAASLLATMAFVANPVRLHLTRESVLGVVFLLGGAGTVIVGDRIKQESNDLSAILFGSAVVVQRMDLVLIGIATVVLLLIHALRMRALVFTAYDPVGARVQGLPVAKLNTFVFLAVGVAVALCTRALGALPVFAFSVLPAMAALTLTNQLPLVFALAAVLGALSGGGAIWCHSAAICRWARRRQRWRWDCSAWRSPAAPSRAVASRRRIDDEGQRCDRDCPGPGREHHRLHRGALRDPGPRQ